MILILCGKSASGKDTIMRKLVRFGFIPLVSHTTRPMRDNEEDGRDYYFVNKNTFETMLEKDQFIEHRSYNTEYGVWFYGLAKKKLDSLSKYITVSDIDGAKSLIDYYGKSNCFVAYINADDKLREERALKRGSFSSVEWIRRKMADEKDFSSEKLNGVANCSVSNNSDNITEPIFSILIQSINWLLSGGGADDKKEKSV